MSEPLPALAVFTALLSRPTASFHETLAEGTDPARWSIAVTQQLGEFAERIRDLSTEELQELHDETFGEPAGARARRRGLDLTVRAELGPDWQRVIAWTHAAEGCPVPDGQGPDAGVLEALGRVQSSLVIARNPYHHLLAALFSYLQAGRGLDRPPRSS